MQRKGNKKNKGGKKKMENGNWGQVSLGGFRMSFPKPRLPALLGAAKNLPAGLSVYPRVALDLPYIGSQTAIASGAVAAVIPIDLTGIANFATRFGNTFKEYCVVGARFEIRCQGPIASQQGFFTATIDEKSSSVPTGNVTDQARLDVLISTTESPNTHVVEWKPIDYLDLEWTAIGTTSTPAWLKLYASNAYTFTGAATTANIVVTGALSLEFRGFV